MIAVRHIASGEIQIVASADGYSDGWAVVADPAPADILTAPYLVQGGALVPDLAAARAARRAIINAARDAAQDGGAVVAGVGTFDSDARSRQFLNGAVMTATLAQANAQPFTIDWTLADNSVVTLDAGGLIAVGVAVALHIDAIQRRARVLKTRIDAAGTLAAIAAVAWTLAD